MNTYLKTLIRTFKRHITRFLSIIFMVLVSVGFCSGIGSAADKIRYSLSDYYRASNVSDFIIKSKDEKGFSSEDISRAKELFGEENAFAGTSFDCNLEIDGKTQLVRLYFFDDFANINTPKLIEGEQSGVTSERADNKIEGVSQGESITLDFVKILEDLREEELDPQFKGVLSRLNVKTYEIGGIVASPLTFGEDGEPSYKNPEDVEIPNTTDGINKLITLQNVFYLPASEMPKYGDLNLPEFVLKSLGYDAETPLVPVGDIYVKAADRGIFNDFSPAYRAFVDGEVQKIESEFENVRVLTLYDNYSFSALHAYADKVMLIGYVLMVAFLFVTALVVLSTMTRLIEEERAQIACLSTLGYSPFKIIFKYLLFAAIATGAGGVGSYFIGMGLSYLIYVVFNYSFYMPPMSHTVAMAFFLIIFAIIVVTTLGATFWAGFKLTRENCASLLHAKPPKAGKKTILERIKPFWSVLPFKYKSTTRNVLRYKSRFFMTVIAVAFSTALVLAGLALLDLCLFQGINSPSITIISIVIVAFAGFLTAVVIYTLTNINISERNRELATLMVLGYHDFEVAGYIYREIYIDAIIGIIFGFPLSLLIMAFLFNIMGMGTFGTVSWFMWLIAPAVVLLFTALVTLILRRKIVKIDMNESLKAVE